MVSIIPPIAKDGSPRAEITIAITFDDSSDVNVTLCDEGAGAFAVIKAEGWLVDPDELVRLAEWVKRACDALDGFHGATAGETPQQANRNDTKGIQ